MARMMIGHLRDFCEFREIEGSRAPAEIKSLYKGIQYKKKILATAHRKKDFQLLLVSGHAACKNPKISEILCISEETVCGIQERKVILNILQ